ncbi:AAA family ATPase [Vibrio parahaemolyticus]|uniref:AAA family ATPase n=1 Tax=Vibrio parahaemolyticus TaxID=670 RepID=UPI0022699FAC|nr:AAA family ATPase [Vibrio parahaemolyticus]MCX8829773.1 ATP-binding protein [Vibrio parahaemolyticus]MCX8931119.1 ATP-binding protein [Vibrio parahaemolyticus]
MSQVTLPLPINPLCTVPQELKFEKLAAFIGGNGAGKSTILKSIFDEKLRKAAYDDYKVVCFSSGQNESYSKHFTDYLNSERNRQRALSLECFYYDKTLSKLLIFLATTSKHDGLVRSFLKQNNYVVENDIDEDSSTSMSFKVKVEQGYINIVQKALEDGVNGDEVVITEQAYHRTLHSFISALIEPSYDFNQPLEVTKVILNSDELAKVSFESDDDKFDARTLFFTQASNNDYFIVKNSIDIFFKRNGNDLTLEELSDGEYQILFIYALIDIFDSDNTLFLLDEADSHLHHSNIDKLWNTLLNVNGSIITTTHLIDSITRAGINRLKIVENGFVKPGNNLKHLTDRLRDLSEVSNVKFHAISLFRNVVLIDNENDWEIFKLLTIRKLSSNIEDKLRIESELSNYIAIKCNSGYQGMENEVFADKKTLWVNNFFSYIGGHPYRTKNVFAICDRDEYPLSNIGMPKCDLLVKGKDAGTRNDKPDLHYLSWKRREVKHYLLSYTALGNDSINDVLDLSPKSQLLPNNNGDYRSDGEYNHQLASINSEIVKNEVKEFINSDDGFCIVKTRAYIDTIPSSEISEDIVKLYNYLVSSNE